ncbi:MAG: nitrogen fixation protein NifQ [Sulfuricella sp.]|nr:nitrogen fixation protein NifQ [Sulfuricella sp.]
MHSQQLLYRAGSPAAIATRAIAWVIGSEDYRPAMLRGIPADDFERLLERYFPGAAAVRASLAASGCAPLRDDEFQDVLDLLLEYRSDDGDETMWLASAVAAACLGNNHLWQDLGLANRQELSDLLQSHFASLYAKNTGNMKWKKFFYKQLCERAEVQACRAPSCAVCGDYKACFGPE